MRQPNARDFESGRKVLLGLIIANIVMYLLPSQELTASLALSIHGLKSGQIYQLVTAMFMHGSFSHIFFNMWALYIFGSIVAPILGGNRFMALYLISGLTGNLLWLLANFNSPQPAFLLGASGAVFGVMPGRIHRRLCLSEIHLRTDHPMGSTALYLRWRSET